MVNMEIPGPDDGLGLSLGELGRLGVHASSGASPIVFKPATCCDERRRLLNFVVVGGGATGVELTGAIAELAKRTLASDFRAI
jgi:hypothetical protein